MQSQVSGLVTPPSGKSFREAVVITEDYIFQRYNSAKNVTSPFPGKYGRELRLRTVGSSFGPGSERIGAQRTKRHR